MWNNGLECYGNISIIDDTVFKIDTVIISLWGDKLGIGVPALWLEAVIDFINFQIGIGTS